jgi:hypothetical protein
VTYDAAERTPDSRGDCSAGTVLEEVVMRHRIPISTTRQGPPPTGYTRTKRTARFPVNTRESASSRDDRRRPEIDRILQGVAGSNPVIPTKSPGEKVDLTGALSCTCPPTLASLFSVARSLIACARGRGVLGGLLTEGVAVQAPLGGVPFRLDQESVNAFWNGSLIPTRSKGVEVGASRITCGGRSRAVPRDLSRFARTSSVRPASRRIPRRTNPPANPSSSAPGP